MKRVFLLLLLNALPIGAVAWILVLRHRGEVTVRALPQESVGTAVLLGAVLGVVIVLGWGVYPLLAQLRDGARRRAKGTLGFFWRGIGALVALDLAVLGVLVLGLFLVEILLLARFALSVH